MDEPKQDFINNDQLKFTGERAIPKEIEYELFQEHLNRYDFALKFSGNKKILDVACGAGYGSKYLIEKGAKSVFGVDISEEAINYAEKKYSQKNLEFLVADAKDLPFEDNYFDILVSFETIEHIKGDKEFLSECRRVLKKGGIFICSTPNKKVFSHKKDSPSNKFHFKEYYAKEFKKLLDEYFIDVEFYGQLDVILLKRDIIKFFWIKIPVIPKLKSIWGKITSSGESDTYKIKKKRYLDKNFKVLEFKENILSSPSYIIAIAKKGE